MNSRAMISAWALSAVAFAAAAAADPVQWRGWSPDLFVDSARDKKLVILDLEAVWCHWCHVMEETTYADPKVQDLLAKHYIAVKVDQDANPDLSNRYGNWGWPATILYAPDGTEIAKLRGYRNPAEMAAILAAFIADPTPGPSAQFEAPAVVPAATITLADVFRDGIHKMWLDTYDTANGGWGNVQKFIHAFSMEYALHRAEAGDARAAAMARQTFDRALALIDPVWGGIYQYSDKVDWSSPHFEKIMQFQANAIRQYSHGALLFGEPRYLAAAKAVADYLTGHMLAPGGAFHTSQDADAGPGMTGKVFYALSAADRAGRTAPPVDTNIYARENGWAIAALAAYGAAARDPAPVATAVKAAAWIKDHRALPGGGFSHGDADRSGPYLGDTLAMGQAFLALYATTTDQARARDAMAAADFILARFKAEAGFTTSVAGETAAGPLAKPTVQLDEMIELARFFNALHRYTGEARFRDGAHHAMRYLASEQVAGGPGFLAGLLVAEAELGIEPVHMTVIGKREDAAAQDLLGAALAYPALYKRVDFWTPSAGPPLNPDVTYPELEKAAVFACSNQICSKPAYSAAELTAAVKGMDALRVKRAP